MSHAADWYIVKVENGHCEIVHNDAASLNAESSSSTRTWGPFKSREEAIARRIGLIRAGHCQPIQPSP